MAKLNFQTILDALQDETKKISKAHLERYSDLSEPDLRLFMQTWERISLPRKIQLLDMLAEKYEEDTLVSYAAIGTALLRDPHSEVRARALRLLREEEDERVGEEILYLAAHDPELEPRIEAMPLLGMYVYYGEIESVSEPLKQKIERLLMNTLQRDENPRLCRRALEALGYSSHNETRAFIESALRRHDPEWVASALRAIRHSQDEKLWHDEVVSKLLDEDPLIRRAAVQAAGELELQDTFSILTDIIEDEEAETDLIDAALWSLSQIGGEDAQTYLINLLDATDDEEMREYLGGVMENLEFSDMFNGNSDLLDFDLDLDRFKDENDPF